jgi:hypothetical protein
MPILFAYSGMALTHLPRLWAARWTKAGWLATGICAILLGSWGWQMLIVEGDRIRLWMNGAV